MEYLNPEKNNIYHVIGIMSGTSLDGVDLAYCVFKYDEKKKWSYQIEQTGTIPYPEEWMKLLPSLMKVDAYTFAKANVDLGYYFGSLIKTFILENNIAADFIASHGHTIFHQPDIGLTAQIGSGASIAATCGLPVVCDFRSTDVAYGGQGAPLVPMGDALLFSEFDYCLNLGGFSNISYLHAGQRIAYDICPVNTLLNKLAQRVGLEYDKDGLIGRTGCIDTHLLERLNSLSYYDLKPPKSLGFEWSNDNIWPILNMSQLSIPDLLRTVIEHVAIQLSNSISGFELGKLLVTGGGVKNIFLMERFRARTKHTIIIPENKVIDYKEAMIFAFLGVLRVRSESNCLQSVTGAVKDSIGGAIYLP